MGARIDFDLLQELKHYGHVNVEDCFNCGNCTAVCPLSTDETPFPRHNIRLLQLGLKERLQQSVDPWLCYYCGECSDTCPRDADPAEAQMAMRRWLTAQYDVTGLGKKFYTSKLWSLGALLVLVMIVLGLVAWLGGPMLADRVALNTFAPVHIVHIADIIMAVGIVLFLGINVLRMHNYILRRGTSLKIPIGAYISELWRLPYQFVTQQRFSKCGDRRPWIVHLILTTGYGLMFVIIVLFLEWFQTEEIYAVTNPQRWLGYYAAGALILGSVLAIRGRILKDRQVHKYSHLSDWLFPILLLLLAVSGLLIHVFRYAGMPMETYYLYIAHMVLVPSIYFVIGPMGKWAHLFYRPLAIYFQAVKQKAYAIESRPQMATASAD